jgi:hypothetical protein
MTLNGSGVGNPSAILVNNIVTALILPAIAALFWQINDVNKGIGELRDQASARLAAVDQRFSDHEKLFADFIKTREQQVVMMQDIQTLKGVGAASDVRFKADEDRYTTGREERLEFQREIGDRLNKIENIVVEISRHVSGVPELPPLRAAP